MLVAVEHSYNLTVITALGEDMVSDLVSHLEISMRRIGLANLSVQSLNLSDMMALWHSIKKQTSVEKVKSVIVYKFMHSIKFKYIMLIILEMYIKHIICLIPFYTKLTIPYGHYMEFWWRVNSTCLQLSSIYSFEQKQDSTSLLTPRKIDVFNMKIQVFMYYRIL